MDTPHLPKEYLEEGGEDFQELAEQAAGPVADVFSVFVTQVFFESVLQTRDSGLAYMLQRIGGQTAQVPVVIGQHVHQFQNDIIPGEKPERPDGV